MDNKAGAVLPNKQHTIARLQKQIDHIKSLCDRPKPTYPTPFKGKTGEETWHIIAQANAGTGETMKQTYERIKNQF